MYRLLIVDDEEIARTGISQFVDWNALGFAVEGLFEDGADVISYLKHNEADVILADMCMCEMSGLELARYIKENGYNTEVVILSAHSDFEFLRGALKLDIFDYLLKPVKKEEITGVFTALRCHLNEKKAGRRNNENNAVNDLITSIVKSISESDISAAKSECEALFKAVPSVSVRNAVHGLFKRIYEECGTGTDNNGIPDIDTFFSSVDSAPYEKLFGVVCETLEQISAAGHSDEADIVQDIKDYVTSHMEDDYTIDDIARSMFFSSSYISHEFKRLTNENLSNYIIRQRMNMAKNHLSNEPDWSIQKIALAVGYRDSRYFQKAFKKFTGKTPREWRRLYCKNGDKNEIK